MPSISSVTAATAVSVVDSSVSCRPSRLRTLRLLCRTSFRRASLRFACAATSTELVADEHKDKSWMERRNTNYGGIRLEETMEGPGRSRLDAWISSRLPVSRARVQSSIREGLVFVNGRTVEKVSQVIKAGDKVICTVSELLPLRAEPEDIPLDIVYEDSHVIVVNKPAHMVVHPAPGNRNGTLVNAILNHCQLPVETHSTIFSEEEDDSDSSDDVMESAFSYPESSSAASVRPGIVHRLDKGTSGLLVVAKNGHSHAHLSEQFKHHTIHRVYVSLTAGVPSPSSARIDIPIARDPNNRIRMVAVSGSVNNKNARRAASRFRVLEVLAGGACALVEWRLETGRTHQIRAHAKYLRIPLLGDEVYGGTNNLVLSLLRTKIPPSRHGYITEILSNLQRPSLHALSLGFKHPDTGEDVKFSCPPPSDFSKVLSLLHRISRDK